MKQALKQAWKWIEGAYRILFIISVMVAFVSWVKGGTIVNSIEMFWKNLNPWQLIFFVSMAVIVLGLIYKFGKFIISMESPKAATKNVDEAPKKIIYDPKDPKPRYLVKGNTYSHIPDPPTFEYLGNLFGFSWNDSIPMSSDDIKREFVKGKELPSIKSYCPK